MAGVNGICSLMSLSRKFVFSIWKSDWFRCVYFETCRLCCLCLLWLGSSDSFLLECWGFSMRKIASSANLDPVASSSPVLVSFLLFALASTSSSILNQSGVRGLPALFQVWGGVLAAFRPVSPMPNLCRVLLMKGCRILSSALSEITVGFLFFLLLWFMMFIDLQMLYHPGPLGSDRCLFGCGFGVGC